MERAMLKAVEQALPTLPGQKVDYRGKSLNGQSLEGLSINHMQVAVNDINQLQASLDCRKWREFGLMPVIEDEEILDIAVDYQKIDVPIPPLILTWKHVQPVIRHQYEHLGPRHWAGNLGAPYGINVPYEWPCMVCAGPAGALRDWSTGSGPFSYVMAIAGVISSQNPAKGVYFALFGIPIAVYRATKDADGDYYFDLVQGKDVLPWIQEP